MSICKKCLSQANVNRCDRCNEPMDNFIDKQRVREAIENVFGENHDKYCGYFGVLCECCRMKKELGL